MDILVIDIGGTSVKLRATSGGRARRLKSGTGMGPAEMVVGVTRLAADWPYDAVSVGYPGEVRGGRPSMEPKHLANGWLGFDFAAAFGRPVKVINDAAMQALGAYAGGRMLFMGLGTGLGTALVVEHVVQPMELTQLPYKNGMSFGDHLRQSGMERLGLETWRREVAAISRLLRNALVADDVVIGGGNARLVNPLPPHCRRGDNADAFKGGALLWQDVWSRGWRVAMRAAETP